MKNPKSGPQLALKAIEEATLKLALLLLITESEWEKAKHWRAWRAEVERQLNQ